LRAMEWRRERAIPFPPLRRGGAGGVATDTPWSVYFPPAGAGRAGAGFLDAPERVRASEVL